MSSDDGDASAPGEVLNGHADGDAASPVSTPPPAPSDTDEEQPLNGASSHGHHADAGHLASGVHDGSLSPGRHSEYRPLVTESKPPECAGFCGLCFRPSEKVLGWARRWRCGGLATPYYWGGWCLAAFNSAVVAAYMAFTPARDEPVLLQICAVLYVVSMYLMLRLQCMDPGVLPRGVRDAEFPTTPCVTDSHVNTTVNGLSIQREDYVTLLNDGTLTVWRWCKTCEIHRPPRAAHCPLCNWCVRDYDHHCPVVGGCIAQRTLSYFTLLLVSYAVQCAYVGVSTLVVVSSHLAKWRDGDEHLPIFYAVCTAGVGFASMISGCWALGMSCAYVNLACKDRTMREEQRNLPTAKPTGRGGDGPRRRSGLSNFFSRICTPNPPSLLAKHRAAERGAAAESA